VTASFVEQACHGDLRGAASEGVARDRLRGQGERLTLRSVVDNPAPQCDGGRPATERVVDEHLAVASGSPRGRTSSAHNPDVVLIGRAPEAVPARQTGVNQGEGTSGDPPSDRKDIPRDGAPEGLVSPLISAFNGNLDPAEERWPATSKRYRVFASEQQNGAPFCTCTLRTIEICVCHYPKPLRMA